MVNWETRLLVHFLTNFICTDQSNEVCFITLANHYKRWQFARPADQQGRSDALVLCFDNMQLKGSEVRSIDREHVNATVVNVAYKQMMTPICCDVCWIHRFFHLWKATWNTPLQLARGAVICSNSTLIFFAIGGDKHRSSWLAFVKTNAHSCD